MKALVRENLIEALIGFLVLCVAAWFLTFAYHRTAGAGGAGYHVDALFTNAGGVGVGTDVRVAGLNVGKVIAARLDPATWQARLTLSLDPAVKLPEDSSAVISSASLLGANNITLVPGGDSALLKDGDEILDTQGNVNLMELIGNFVNQTASGGSDHKNAP